MKIELEEKDQVFDAVWEKARLGAINKKYPLPDSYHATYDKLMALTYVNAYHDLCSGIQQNVYNEYYTKKGQL